MRKKILNALTDKWQSTTKIMKLIGSRNWYKVSFELQAMEKKGIVEMMIAEGRRNSTYWRMVE